MKLTWCISFAHFLIDPTTKLSPDQYTPEHSPPKNPFGAIIFVVEPVTSRAVQAVRNSSHGAELSSSPFLLLGEAAAFFIPVAERPSHLNPVFLPFPFTPAIFKFKSHSGFLLLLNFFLLV